MRESDIEGYLRKRVKETGGEHRKCTWSGRRGAPDDFCMWSLIGAHAWVECKRPGEQPTLQQEKEHRRLRGAGCRVFVVSSLTDVDLFILTMTGRKADER